MNQTETKQCQNCKQDFIIEPDDFKFYEKIKVPAPTLCPDCRFQRRYSWRNQMNLHKMKCDLCGNSMVGIYPSNKPFPVYCQSCWWSDKWDGLEYAKDYDFSRPFFDQFHELQMKVPRVSLSNQNHINSEYCSFAVNNKNCYLCFSIGDSEDCYYSGPNIIKTRSSIACSMSRENELNYETISCDNCFMLSWSQNCQECTHSAFLFNCRNCSNCIGCVNLRNKKYYILNQPYSKEEYMAKVKELNLNSYASLAEFNKKFQALKLDQIHRAAITLKTTDCTGDNIVNSRNCRNVFEVSNSENCRFSFLLNGGKECYDISNSYPSVELSYEVISPVESSRIYFSNTVWSGSLDVYYSDICVAGQDLFGCIGVRNKQYCILNKQYTKEEYEELVPKIVEHMKTTGEYGEFFPMKISPWAYNESIAIEYFPLTEEEVKSQGLRWYEPTERDYKITIPKEQIPDDIEQVGDTICKETLECIHKGKCNHNCGTAFRILPEELAIYQRLKMPLPRLCPNCRYRDRLSRRNPLKLWHRTCMCTTQHQHHSGQCPNEFETSYAPDRPEIVYCESCYQSEVV